METDILRGLKERGDDERILKSLQTITCLLEQMLENQEYLTTLIREMGE